MQTHTVAIHQPNFIPWLGFFHKMSLVDTFVLFDDVQVPQGKSFASRARVKINSGECWITVPTLSKSLKQDFHSTHILNSPWRQKTLKTINLAYKKAPFFNTYFEAFEKNYLSPDEVLFDYNCNLLLFLKESLKIKTDIRLSSELGLDPEITGDLKILAILEALKATTYVSGKGSGSTRYIDEDVFREKKIDLKWQEFNQSPYLQQHGEFIPKLSAIDYLFNCGPFNPDQ
jgi:hypothetical protein